MKVWTRAPRRLVCGNCASAVQIGEPMLVLSNPDYRWRKFRCVACAGPAPADLPDAVAPADVGYVAPVRQPAMTSTRVLSFDWKAKQSGQDR